MSQSWSTTFLATADEAFSELADLSQRQWLFRGHDKLFNALIPSMDRYDLARLPRHEKIDLERQSIKLFRSSAQFFAHDGERDALEDDIVTLMVLRHYGVPTRLLDWSSSPYVAAYFAASEESNSDGEIWGFDEPMYRDPGAEQWKAFPETTTGRSGDRDKFDAKLTAFTKHEPPDWFICAFYPRGFPRQNRQYGAYTLTARFGRDHASKIADVLPDESGYHRWVVSSSIKQQLLSWLSEEHGISRGTLFPDTAGAADTAGAVFKVRRLTCR